MLSIILILVLYLLSFALLHSFLASLPAKRLARRILGSRVDPWYIMAFSVIALITVLPLVALVYSNPGPQIYVVPFPWFWLMTVLQGVVGLASLRAFLDAPHRFLIRAQLSDPKSPQSFPIGIRGVYCWVRDPFLLSGLLLLWLTPFMTLHMLILYLITSVYLYLGSLHWESRLVVQFGDAYRDYQKKVPRIIPRRSWCYVPGHN